MLFSADDKSPSKIVGGAFSWQYVL